MEKEKWEIEFDDNFCKLRDDGYMELINHHAPDIKAFIRSQREQVKCEGQAHKGEHGRKMYQNGYRDGIEKATEAIPDDLHYSCDGKTCDCTVNLKEHLESKLL